MTWDLHLGDCLAGMATLPDKSVDHVITDPPFEAEAHTLQRRIKQNISQRAGAELSGAREKPLSFAAISPDGRIEASRQMVRLSRGWVVVFCQAEAVSLWRDSLDSAGAKYKRACVWIKPDGMPQLTGDRPGMGYESFVCAWAGEGRSRWNGGGRVGVYSYARQGEDDGWHETVKPIALMTTLVRDFTTRGDLILDPFAGSGTTGVAALRNGRRFVGWEREPKWHEAACKRLRATREQRDLFEVRP